MLWGLLRVLGCDDCINVGFRGVGKVTGILP
jgi:hypothetical protein